MEGNNDRPICLITGITGYLGSHCCLAALQDGTFKIRGSVRDPNNQKKMQPIKDAFGDLYNDLELAKMDLLDEAAIDKAIEGCTYVIHTASPFPLEEPKDENLLIKPAVEGTLAVMRAARKHKVKRVVITSSVVSVQVSKDRTKKHFSEADWTDLTVAMGYAKSKTMAE